MTLTNNAVLVIKLLDHWIVLESSDVISIHQRVRNYLYIVEMSHEIMHLLANEKQILAINTRDALIYWKYFGTGRYST